MRAFILRRLELTKGGKGDAALIGSSYSADTLARARVPHPQRISARIYRSRARSRRAATSRSLQRFSAADLPVLICRGQSVLRNPTNRQIAECLGLNEGIDETQVRDVLIVGAGPVRPRRRRLCGVRRARRRWSSKRRRRADKPASSSKIENYLGFPAGVSGAELAGRAYNAGAEIRRRNDRRPQRQAPFLRSKALRHRIGRRQPAHWRGPSSSPPAPSTGNRRSKTWPRFEGRGIFYGATFIESQICGANEVAVVGGGNSAGQAAVFLSQTARHVHMLVRSELAETMSRYLIRRIEEQSRRSRSTCAYRNRLARRHGPSGTSPLAEQANRRRRDPRHCSMSSS